MIQSEFYGFYDDEGHPEYDETETFISIEKALEMVYPNEEKNLSSQTISPAIILGS